MMIIVKPPRYDYCGLSISRYMIISIYCPSLTYTSTHITQGGCTALHLAAQEGHEDVVELLLDAKANPELEEKVINL